MKEKSVETQIMMFIRYNGGWVQKVHSGGMMKSYTRKTGFMAGKTKMYKMNLADEGTPDLLACIAGKFIAIEVKKDAKEIAKWQRTAETDRRSAAQHAQQDSIRRAGGTTIVVCSVEELEADFKELGLI